MSIENRIFEIANLNRDNYSVRQGTVVLPISLPAVLDWLESRWSEYLVGEEKRGPYRYFVQYRMFIEQVIEALNNTSAIERATSSHTFIRDWSMCDINKIRMAGLKTIIERKRVSLTKMGPLYD